MKKFRITVNGRTYEVQAEPIVDAPTSAPSTPVSRSASLTHHPFNAPSATPSANPTTGPGDVISPLAGKVVSVDVTEGDKVTQGQKLLTLEAMKMNTLVNAPKSGTVKKISATAGVAVAEGELLLTIE